MSPSPTKPVRGRSRAPTAVDREVLDYLGREIQPTLRSAAHRPLANALRSAVGAGSVSGLGRLEERQRRELLVAIESRLSRSRRVLPPRALVRLTSVVCAVPDRRVRAVASPAR
jgi:hypothetical protein